MPWTYVISDLNGEKIVGRVSKKTAKTKTKKDKLQTDKLGIDKLKKAQTGFNSLKNKVDKLDVDELVTVPVDLSKLIDVVKNDVAKCM